METCLGFVVLDERNLVSPFYWDDALMETPPGVLTRNNNGFRSPFYWDDALMETTKVEVVLSQLLSMCVSPFYWDDALMETQHPH